MKRLVVLLLAALPAVASAHSAFLTLEDATLSATTTEQAVTFYATTDTKDGKAAASARRQHVVHIRYRPNNLEQPATSAEHQAGLTLLKESVEKKKPITVLVTSGRGWRPIEGRPGHYRTDALKIQMHEGRPLVMFVHGNESAYAKD